ncbi:hypothetical protein [Maritimibacter sp. DP1N21-5]|uniref:hypothetical protein n=1 Tax=Maritimibacter sp. DP1N21-5 TaxID=2836867 RepID=UPI001C46444E|nr:hypothetical protein [Maritimibacter sp. DP1N21-5]MBV7408775.1 hypothetical protein [Maritimibacter sp. DP1N21-5]
MALTNATQADVGTSPATVYTVPASTVATIININLANTEATQIEATVTANGVVLLPAIPIPAGASFSYDCKVVLEAAQTLVVTSDTAASLDVFVSMLEQA